MYTFYVQYIYMHILLATANCVDFSGYVRECVNFKLENETDSTTRTSYCTNYNFICISV